MRLPDILFLDIVVHVKECNYAIYVYIAEQAGALALERLEWMSVRHPRYVLTAGNNIPVRPTCGSHCTQVP